MNNIDDLHIFKDYNDNQIYISVIVPCYNAENYIDRCIQSIINQSFDFEHFQIILVNDASTDGTFEKLIYWKQMFPKEIVVVSYKENLRQGGARNIGILCADGEYIGFVDSDDWIEYDMYDILYQKTKSKKYDVVRAKFIREHSKNQKNISSEKQNDICYDFEQKNGWYIQNITNYGVNGEIGSVCSAIYLKDVIIKNDIWFPEKIAYEDNYWNSILNLYIKNTCIVDKIVYHYFINKNSTVTQKNALHQLDRLNIEILKVEEYKQRGAFDTLYHTIEMEFIRNFYLNTLYIVFTRFDFMPDIFNFMKSKIYLYFPEFNKNSKILDDCNQREKLLLSLLEIPAHLTVDDMNKIKAAYLKTFV